MAVTCGKQDLKMLLTYAHMLCLLGRYKLPVVVLIMNNSGIYGGDRRQQVLRDAAHKGAVAGGFADDPEPTSFVPKAKYALPGILQLISLSVQLGLHTVCRSTWARYSVSLVHSISR